MSARNYTNAAIPVELTATVDDGTTDLVLPVVSTAGYPDTPFLLAIDRKSADEEVVLCTSKDASNFTVTRGFDGTTGKAHTSGALVEHVSAAIDYAEANAHINNTALDEHSQYMKADGARHDLNARHAVGGVVPRGLVGDIVAETVGATAAAGETDKAADAGHRHAMPTAQEIQNAIVPVGTVWHTFASSAPTGWLICNGAAVSRTTYASLFAVIGTVWGSGDGTTTFNLPDARGRALIGVGYGAGLTNRALGQYPGSETHVMSWYELPTHTHSQNSHYHQTNIHDHISDEGYSLFAGTNNGTTKVVTNMTLTMGSGGSGSWLNYNLDHGARASTSAPNTKYTTATNQNAGNSYPFTIMGPSLVANIMVKV